MADYSDIIIQAASEYGLDPSDFLRYAKIESNNNPRNVTGEYKGLFQLGNAEWKKYGGGRDIFDPYANAQAFARMQVDQGQEFEKKYGRPASSFDRYMVHNQGPAGYDAHMSNPEGVAWQNIRPYYTDEAARRKGFKSGDEYAQAAIWGNLTPAQKRQFGNDVNNVTSNGFVGSWQDRFKGISPGITTGPVYAGDPSGADMPPNARTINAPPGATAQLRNLNMPSGMPAIMGGGGGENDMPSLLRGGISALQDPETMAYLQMIVKGLNPWSSLDPNKALANAQHLNMQREEARRAQSNTDRAYRLQERQANEPQTITRPDGSIVQIPKVGTGAGAPNQVLPAVNSPTEAAKIADELDYKPGTPERTQFLKDFYMKKTSTDDLIEYNQAKKEGFAGTLEQWMAQKRSTAGKYNLNPVYGSKNGQPVLLQTGNMGEAVETKLPEGVTVGKEPIKLDTGTSFILIDPVTRQYIKEIPKNVAEKERQEKVGQATGEGQVALPTVVSTAERMLSQIENVQKHPGRDLGTGAIFGRVPGIAGQQLDFVERMDQLKGGAFLQAFQILKGGGAITETEGTKGTTAIARLNRAKSAADIDAALNDLKDVIQGGVKNARIKAGLPAGSEQSQPATSLPPPPSGFKIVP